MPHEHFCDIAGHKWLCEGHALRPFMGNAEPSVCVCMSCQQPVELGDHSDCEIELVACPEHIHEEQCLMTDVEEFLRTPDGLYMAELFARRDALADDDPEKDAVVAEILRHTFPGMKNTQAEQDDRED